MMQPLMHLSLKRVPIWGWIFMAAAALYAATWPLFYVGAFNDDAAYISGALSLWQGSYRALYLVGQPPMTVYPPAYPLFLMPFVVAVQPHWESLKLTSMALSLVNVVLAWRLFSRWLPSKGSAWALAFFALNSVVAIHSTAVMSEPLFITCLVGAFLLLQRVLKDPTPLCIVALTVLTGCAALTRSAGILLIPVVSVSLYYGGRRSAALQVLFGAGAMFGVWVLRNSGLSHQWSGYSSAWATGFSELGDPDVFIHNANRVLFAFLSTLFPGIDYPYTPIGFVANAFAGLLILATIHQAWKRGAQSILPFKAFRAGVILMITGWFILHTLWTAPSPRYAMPMLPLVVGLLVEGAFSVYQQSLARRKHIAKAGLVFAGVLFLCGNLFALRDAAKPSDKKPERPDRTLEWIKTHLPESSVIQTAKAAETYLYTGRVCVSLLLARDAEQYRYSLLVSSVTHVLTRPMRMASSGLNFDRGWRLNQKWASAWPDAYRLLYHNASESTALYEVVNDASYRDACERFEQAKDALRDRRLGEGLQKLEETLQLYPRHVSALNAYGATLLLQGKNLSLAKEKLQTGLRIRPDHAVALLNLARVYRIEGSTEKARVLLERAEAVIQTTEEYDYLRSAILQEKQSL